MNDEELRELCLRVVQAQDDFKDAVFKLQIALRNRFEDISNSNTAILLKMPRLKLETTPSDKDGTEG